jgi:putative ABC transport system permease protein
MTSISFAQLGGAAVIIVAVTTLASGFYPALVLSRFQPVKVLRASSSQRSGGAGWFQKSLVVMQFAASVGLIFGTLVIYQQLQYVQTKTLGFDGAQVLTAELGRVPADRMASIREEVQRHPGVESATIGSGLPGAVSVYYAAQLRRLSEEAVTSSEDEMAQVARVEVDAAYTETLGLEVVAGRGFSEERDVGGAKKYLLNETAVRTLGWTVDEAVGKPFIVSSTPEEDASGEVVGVVRDFHVSSLREEIANVAMELRSAPSGYGRLAARLRPEAIQDAREHVASVLAEAGMGEGANLEFLDDTFDAMYRTEMRIAQIFSIFSGIAILIACMGLFGLAAFTIEQRKKEIGIRKVLGASVGQIVGIVFRTYAGLVSVAVVVGLPLAYHLVSAWLEGFAYRADIGTAVFIGAAMLALSVATVSVGYHAIAASRMDPVRSLRSE